MRSLTAVLLALAALALPTAASAAAPKCPEGARCGSIKVPVDRAGTVPGTYPIAYATLPASGPRAGTIFFLAGGPGEAAVIYTKEIAELLKPIRSAYDIVLVDQRGTGRSGDVECLESGSSSVARECGKELGDRRAFLSTKETARDLDDLRAAFGLDKIIPLGVSYGTKVAGEYARRFPDRTQAVVLDSPVGVGPIDLLFLEGIAAAPRVLRESCATGPCAQTVKDPGVSLYAAVKRVGTRGLRTPVRREDGVRTATVEESDVLETLLLGDADQTLRADMPAAVASLARGDGAPLVHVVDRLYKSVAAQVVDEPTSEEEPGFSVSRYLATACLESTLPWSPASAPSTRRAARSEYLKRLGSRPFAPFRPSAVWENSVFDLCVGWPATPVPEPVPDAGPDVPVLVLSGRSDLRTPLELATRVAAAYPRATLLDVPNVGHSVLTADRTRCAVQGLQTFLSGAAPAPCTTPPAYTAARYLPASAKGLSAPEIARYTVEALLHDLDAFRQAASRFTSFDLNGLRSGSATATKSRLRLRKVAWFRGVTVSGTVTLKGKGRVTVRDAGGRVRTVRL
ncbi:alpha/beta hydrolase [Solirubrobacter phytolaccae]|uniref:Alpha/beta hydrolase n=1 Tax=Solirubrobacter phytolaccae TaxID=1404360 RepID=A0A9X3NG73_9ACTN|nr:alpha/beta hydrolase [Solirubrobacter phytolaccae]MDA0184749.1 alpha/beta hydrolase [Solirubrobacter phytolaccae]